MKFNNREAELSAFNEATAREDARRKTLPFSDDCLNNTNLEALHRRVMAFMSETQPGPEPTEEEVRRAMGKA